MHLVSFLESRWASCTVPSCGKRDGGQSKGLQDGPHYPTPYFPGAEDSVSSDIFTILLKSKYITVKTFFLATEPVAGLCRYIFPYKIIFFVYFSFYISMVFMNWKFLRGLQYHFPIHACFLPCPKDRPYLSFPVFCNVSCACE